MSIALASKGLYGGGGGRTVKVASIVGVITTTRIVGVIRVGS